MFGERLSDLQYICTYVISIEAKLLKYYQYKQQIEVNPVQYLVAYHSCITFISRNILSLLLCRLPYTFLGWGGPVRGENYPGQSAFKVGWPVSFEND